VHYCVQTFQSRTVDFAFGGIPENVALAISRFCGPVAKSASSSRQPLVLRRSSVLASAWTFFLSFRELPIPKSALPVRHIPAGEKR